MIDVKRILEKIQTNKSKLIDKKNILFIIVLVLLYEWHIKVMKIKQFNYINKEHVSEIRWHRGLIRPYIIFNVFLF